jgi:hypothetical protein
MSIQLTKYSFTKELLSAASRDEQHLFLLAGHLLTELSILTRFVAWSSEYETEKGPIEDSGIATSFIALLYYISKIYEGWQLVRERFTPKIQALYLPKFSEDQRKCYADLDEYFNGEGRSPIEKVRNNFGFHNHDQFELLLAALNKHPDPMFYVYIHEAPAMCLFEASEQVVGYCVGRIVDNSIDDAQKYKSALLRLASDTSVMNSKLQDVLLAFQMSFMQQHIHGQARVAKVSIDPPMKFEDVRFPYFTQLPLHIGAGK